jgi:hypothetical protein
MSATQDPAQRISRLSSNEKQHVVGMERYPKKTGYGESLTPCRQPRDNIAVHVLLENFL